MTLENLRDARATRPDITKERGYESMYDAQQRRPNIKLETNLDTLVQHHSSAIGFASGNQTFRDGAGGLTRPLPKRIPG